MISSKEKLIEAATELFEKYGYEKVTIKDIFTRVNGTSGRFYHYFKSKDEIYQVTIGRYIEKTIKEKRQIIYNDKISFSTKLISLSEIAVSNYKKFVSTFKPTNQTGLGNIDYINSIFHQMLQQLEKDFCNMIDMAILKKEYKKEGDIKKVSSLRIARFILYGLWGTLYSNFEDLDYNPNSKDLIILTKQVLGIKE